MLDSETEHGVEVPVTCPSDAGDDEPVSFAGEVVLFDIETDGFLEDLTRVHCIAAQVVGGDLYSWGPGEVEHAVRLLEEAKELWAHFGIGFDIPALKKVYPWFNPKGKIRDTLLLSQLLWPDIQNRDFAMRNQGKGIPPKFIGRHSLQAWGHRLGIYKGDFAETTDWSEWSQEMQEYCEQDVRVLSVIRERVIKNCEERFPEHCVEMEHRFAELMVLQQDYGFPFHEDKAHALYADLADKRDKIKDRLRTEFFPPWWVDEGLFVPKKRRRMKMKDFPPVDVNTITNDGKVEEYHGPPLCEYSPDAPFHKIKLTEFNPGSRHHIADRLMTLYGWEPKEFTDNGSPKVDETILSPLPYEPASLLSEYFILEKRIGYLSEGKQALLKQVGKDGRIHGRVHSAKAVTRRCSHTDPNIAQCPRAGSAYGAEFRSLFHAGEGKFLVGADAAGIEARVMAHYLHPFDDGQFLRAVIEGNKDDETDVHSLNAKALGLDPKEVYTVSGRTVKGRDLAKTFFYAFIYGAGDEKIGLILGVSDEEIDQLKTDHREVWNYARKRLSKDKRPVTKRNCATIVKGNVAKKQYLDRTPALKSLKDAVSKAVDKRGGYLKACDGGMVFVRSKHSAMNTLFQSAGAIIMKRAAVILYDDLTASGLIHGEDFAHLAHVHDEVQMMAKDEETAHVVGKTAVRSIIAAGEEYHMLCPMDGDYAVGQTWYDTH